MTPPIFKPSIKINLYISPFCLTISLRNLPKSVFRVFVQPSASIHLSHSHHPQTPLLAIQCSQISDLSIDRSSSHSLQQPVVVSVKSSSTGMKLRITQCRNQRFIFRRDYFGILEFIIIRKYIYWILFFFLIIYIIF